MFKTKVGDKYWIVTQPDHMEIAGYLAAHWGNYILAAPGVLGAEGQDGVFSPFELVAEYRALPASTHLRLASLQSNERTSPYAS